MEKQKKIYAGSGKKQNDNWFKVNLNFSELEKYAEEYMGKKYVKVNINVGEPDKYGKEVSVSIDQFKPVKKDTPSNHSDNNGSKESFDSLPF